MKSGRGVILARELLRSACLGVAILLDAAIAIAGAAILLGVSGNLVPALIAGPNCPEPCDGPQGLAVFIGLGLGTTWLAGYAILALVRKWSLGAVVIRDIRRGASTRD